VHAVQFGMGAFGGKDGAAAVVAGFHPAADALLACAAFIRKPIGIDFSSVDKVTACFHIRIQQSKRSRIVERATERNGPKANSIGLQVSLGNFGVRGYDLHKTTVQYPRTSVKSIELGRQASSMNIHTILLVNLGISVVQ
jgi:hypothetical protein